LYLQHLSLLNFRNYRQLELDLPKGPIVLYGDNAQGKTNLFEAAYLLSIGKSFRTDNERHVVNREAARTEGQALVAGRFQGRREQIDIRVGYQCVWPAVITPEEIGVNADQFQVRKRIRVNGEGVPVAQMVGLAPTVLFSTADVDLVFGAPSLRRRFLDILISQLDNRYLQSLQRYQRVLSQRNQLLRLIREGRASEEETVFWDEELVREGAFIMHRRREALSALQVLARERLRSLTSGSEMLELVYEPSASVQGVEDEAQALVQTLAAQKERERMLGMTVAGPHRDDMALLLNALPAAVYASRGQARTIGLALRLAEATHLADSKGEEPILLLDDVLSELDTSRRQQVMDAALAHEQALITTTDLPGLEGSALASATLLRVTKGGVTPSDTTLRRRQL
jgi:DNA replication and repair protein RecF